MSGPTTGGGFGRVLSRFAENNLRRPPATAACERRPRRPASYGAVPGTSRRRDSLTVPRSRAAGRCMSAYLLSSTCLPIFKLHELRELTRENSGNWAGCHKKAEKCPLTKNENRLYSLYSLYRAVPSAHVYHQRCGRGRKEVSGKSLQRSQRLRAGRR